jgi:hypothetical protein
MKFQVKYTGASTRMKRRINNEPTIVEAESKRDAVDQVYKLYLDSDYFPQDDGSIRDAAGNEIATPTSDRISYDGGEFIAEMLVFVIEKYIPNERPKYVSNVDFNGCLEIGSTPMMFESEQDAEDFLNRADKRRKPWHFWSVEDFEIVKF